MQYHLFVRCLHSYHRFNLITPEYKLAIYSIRDKQGQMRRLSSTAPAKILERSTQCMPHICFLPPIRTASSLLISPTRFWVIENRKFHVFFRVCKPISVTTWAPALQYCQLNTLKHLLYAVPRPQKLLLWYNSMPLSSLLAKISNAFDNLRKENPVGVFRDQLCVFYVLTIKANKG